MILQRKKMSTVFTSVLLLGCLLYCTSDIAQQPPTHIYHAAFPLRGGVKGSVGGSNFLLLPRSVALLRMRQLREQQAAKTEQEELGVGAVGLAVNRSYDGHNETLSREKPPGDVNADLNEDEPGRVRIPPPACCPCCPYFSCSFISFLLPCFSLLSLLSPSPLVPFAL